MDLGAVGFPNRRKQRVAPTPRNAPVKRPLTSASGSGKLSLFLLFVLLFFFFFSGGGVGDKCVSPGTTHKKKQTENTSSRVHPKPICVTLPLLT